METNWYYATGNERKGPVTESALVELLRQGSVRNDDLVWTEGMADWTPLKNTRLAQQPAAASLSTPPPPAFAAPAPVYSQPQSAEIPLSPLPQGMIGWAKFNGIMLIIQGALSCIGCITAIIGVPMIMAGVALSGAAGILENLGGVSAGTLPFFQKFKSFNLAFGIYHIIMIVGLLCYILFVILFFGTFAAMMSKGMSGMVPAHP